MHPMLTYLLILCHLMSLSELEYAVLEIRERNSAGSSRNGFLEIPYVLRTICNYIFVFFLGCFIFAGTIFSRCSLSRSTNTTFIKFGPFNR